MSWAPGRDEVLAMLDRHDLEIVIASMDLATGLLTQSDEAIATAMDAADAGRWYSAYANLWDAVRKALSALRQAQGLRPTRTGGHIAVEHAAVAQFSGAMGARAQPHEHVRHAERHHRHHQARTQWDSVKRGLARRQNVAANAAGQWYSHSAPASPLGRRGPRTGDRDPPAGPTVPAGKTSISLTFQLTVTDSNGATGTDSVVGKVVKK